MPKRPTTADDVSRASSIEGFEVLVGRGDRENDALTFRIAEPRDFWLHVAGCPGSHVVVRNPDDLPELPKAVLDGAARLAAFHSKARNRSGKVDVHVCRVADIAKVRGAPAGEVRLRRYDVVRVYVRPRDVEP
jgi:predicted ribosome quality control (RQC) complex YloA/Tae2 family protein